MCGRTTLTITADDLRRTFGYEVPPDYRPRFNIAPTQLVLGIVEEDGATDFRHLRWGLVPFWAKDPSVGNRMINARAETVTGKPAFRTALETRRCLVVVDGFYEWQATRHGKRPHRIHLSSGEPFTLAGIWDRWGRGDEAFESCSIITTDANIAVSALHDRMPVIIQPEDRARWTSSGAGVEELQPLLRPHPGDDLDIYEVSPLVNSPENDGPECIEPFESPADEALQLDFADWGR